MSTATIWDTYQLGQKIVEVLGCIEYEVPDHHFGRPFVTAYQLAVLFKERFPEDFEKLRFPIGGKNSGVQFSLASYLGRQLSGKIKSGELAEDVEGCFLSNRKLRPIEVVADAATITSSLSGSNSGVSMFRLRCRSCCRS